MFAMALATSAMTAKARFIDQEPEFLGLELIHQFQDCWKGKHLKV